MPVNENPKTICSAASIGNNNNVHPSFDRNLIRGCDGNGIAGPEMNQRPLQSSLLNQEFVPAACGIRPSTRAMKNHRSLLLVGRLEPKRNTERFVTCKITDRQIDGVVSGELDGIDHFACHDFVCAFQNCRFVSRNLIDKFVSHPLVKRKMAKLAAQQAHTASNAARIAFRQPFLECFSLRRPNRC